MKKYDIPYNSLFSLLAPKSRLQGETQRYPALIAMMRHPGILGYFSFLAGEQDVAHKKPAPDMVNLALGTLGVTPVECMVVGDTVYDIKMGRRASADTCAVTWGNNSADELRLPGPTFLVDSFAEIVSLLKP
jgi:phosphoglycolate phosphatase